MEWLELALRLAFGAQMIFWGLNGFLNWMAPPPSDPRIVDFVEACYRTRFIMPTVKALEIFSGILLIIPGTQVLALILFAPIVFVVTGLHILFNSKPWSVLVPVTLPYLALITIHWPILIANFF